MSITTLRAGSSPRLTAVSMRRRLAGYVALTKPRIIELLLVTTVPTMVVAARGLPGLALVVYTLIGGSLAAGGANAINMVIDRDIDAVMQRTANRPLVTGVLQPGEAFVFALGLEIGAFAELWFLVNFLSAVLAVSATGFYIFVYTLWLKRSSRLNVVIGGAAGAVPVLVGWAAVRGSLAWAPVALFAVIFVWTPPHTWALAIKYREDYCAAEVPMLPSVATFAHVARQILAYSVLLVVTTMVFGWVGHMGSLYWAAALGLGAVFVALAVQVYRLQTARSAIRLFAWSITYVTLLFSAMALDQLIR